MSITIVTTASGSTSNSYVTTSEMTDYFEQNPLFYSTWTDIPNKDTWVVFAATAIDRLSFSGSRYTTTQRMQFPRDITDDYTDAGYVPQAVKDAQCEMLIYQKLHVDSITMNPNPKTSGITIDSSTVTSFFEKENPFNQLAAGGNMKTVFSLLKIWTGASYMAHLGRA